MSIIFRLLRPKIEYPPDTLLFNQNACKISCPPPKKKSLFFSSKRACNIKHLFNLFGWAKKVNMIPFFADLSGKDHFSHAHILSKKHPFSKQRGALMSIFCQKNVHSVKNTVLSCHLFSNFLLKPRCYHAHI